MASLVKELFFSGVRAVDGTPVSSGTIMFTVVGSTSQQVTVYADKDEAQPLTQPIQLDAAGRAQVYVKDQCEIQVWNALGALQLTTLNGSSINPHLIPVTWAGSTVDLQAVLTNLETTIGTGALYKASNGTGAVPRYLGTVLRDKISPYDFAAVGNGSADDTVPLQRAVNAAIALGVPLYLDFGIYKITASIVVNGALHIYGNGAANSAILATSEAFDGIMVNVPSGQVNDGFVFERFAVTIPNTSGLGYSAINVEAGNYGEFNGLALQGTNGIIASASQGCVATACTASIKGSAGHSATGFLLSNFGCATKSCAVTAVAVNYSTGFSVPMVDGCVATGCYNGFIGWIYGQITASIASGCTVAMQGQPGFESGNSWSIAPFIEVDTGGGTPSFAWNPAYAINVFKPTGGSSLGNITITWPASPSLVPGKVYTIIIQPTNTGWPNVTLPMQFRGPSTGTINLGTCVLSTWVVSTLGTLLLLTPWTGAIPGWS